MEEEGLLHHLLGVVEHNTLYTNQEVGWNGRKHNGFVFCSSKFCPARDTGVFVPRNPLHHSLPAPFIANGAHLMRHWLMTPYGETWTGVRGTLIMCFVGPEILLSVPEYGLRYDSNAFRHSSLSLKGI